MKKVWGFLLIALLIGSKTVMAGEDPNSSALFRGSHTDSLLTLKGQVVCINEELAKLRGAKPMCDRYGHLLGLKTSDGTIWSFFLNPIGKELRQNIPLKGKTLLVTGKLFYEAKLIEVREYRLIENNSGLKSERKRE